MIAEIQYDSVNKAFSKQSESFDHEDFNNPILQYMRHQVRAHVMRFLKPEHHMLEINAGTGIDAVFFALRGNTIHATDLSEGMIRQLLFKKQAYHLGEKLTVQQLSYTELYRLNDHKFDYVFSNFGGLNCIDDLSEVTRNLHGVLKNGAFVTLVIMPQACPWEWLSILKGNFRFAFRRFHRNGAMAKLEGENFTTYYHPLHKIKKALGNSFKLIKSEGLGAIIPPPDKMYFPEKKPTLFKLLKIADEKVRHHFPFNRWADHIIVTFQYIY